MKLTFSQIKQRFDNKHAYTKGYLPPIKELNQMRIDYEVSLPMYDCLLHRPLDWSEVQKTEYLLGVLNDYTYPQFVTYLHHTENQLTHQILYGKNRLHTLIAFSKGEIPIYYKEGTYYIDDLENTLKNKLLNHRPPAVIYQTYNDRPMTDRDKIKIFLRQSFEGMEQSTTHRLFLQRML